jgi:hypothetical protein
VFGRHADEPLTLTQCALRIAARNFDSCPAVAERECPARTMPQVLCQRQAVLHALRRLFRIAEEP